MKILSVVVLSLCVSACGLKLSPETSDIFLKIAARNLTIKILDYAPDLKQPLHIFLKAAQMALENNEQQAIALLEKEAYSYLKVRFADNPVLLQDIVDLWALVDTSETNLPLSERYKAVVQGALEAYLLI